MQKGTPLKKQNLEYNCGLQESYKAVRRWGWLDVVQT